MNSPLRAASADLEVRVDVRRGRDGTEERQDHDRGRPSGPALLAAAQPHWTVYPETRHTPSGSAIVTTVSPTDGFFAKADSYSRTTYRPFPQV